MIPSGKLSHNYGKSPCFMGKFTISMTMFNSYVSHYDRHNSSSRLCKTEPPQSWSVSTAKKTSNQHTISMLWKSMYQHHSRIGNGILMDINGYQPLVPQKLGVAIFFNPWPRCVERTISWAGLTGPADVITVKKCGWYLKMGNWAPISGSFTGTVRILTIGLTQWMEWASIFSDKATSFRGPGRWAMENPWILALQTWNFFAVHGMIPSKHHHPLALGMSRGPIPSAQKLSWCKSQVPCLEHHMPRYLMARKWSRSPISPQILIRSIELYKHIRPFSLQCIWCCRPHVRLYSPFYPISSHDNIPPYTVDVYVYMYIYIYIYIPLHPTTSHYIPLYIHVKSYINITYPPSDWFRRVPPFFRDSGLKVWFGKVARRPVTLVTPGPEMLRSIIFYGKVHWRSLKYSIETCVSIETCFSFKYSYHKS